MMDFPQYVEQATCELRGKACSRTITQPDGKFVIKIATEGVGAPALRISVFSDQGTLWEIDLSNVDLATHVSRPRTAAAAVVPRSATFEYVMV
jgi:hypothetical protein